MCGVCEILVGVLPSLLGVWIALALMGVAIGYANIVAISWIQARVDHAMIGRVMSLVMLMGVGITPLSLAVSGGLIDLDATALFVAAGLLILLTAAASAAVGFVRLFDAATATRGRLPTPLPGADRRERRRLDPHLLHPVGVDAVAPPRLAVAARGEQRADQPQVGRLVVRVALEDPEVVAGRAVGVAGRGGARPRAARVTEMYAACASSRSPTAQSSYGSSSRKSPP